MLHPTPTRIIELVCKFVRHVVIKRFLRSFVFVVLFLYTLMDSPINSRVSKMGVNQLSNWYSIFGGQHKKNRQTPDKNVK